MPRKTPSDKQDFLSSVILPLLSLALLPVSIWAVIITYVLGERTKKAPTKYVDATREVVGSDGALGVVSGGASGSVGLRELEGAEKVPGVVMISGGRMAKGLALARGFKRAGWKVIGVEEEGWGTLCPMRFSTSVDRFYLLPPASRSYRAYSAQLQHIAQAHRVTLFIPVSGAGSSIEDAQAAQDMFKATRGRCQTFIQDPETMLDLHDKHRFMALVQRLGFIIPSGKRVESVDEAIEFLKGEGKEPKFVFKCMGLDENRGDMTLFPLRGDDASLGKTRSMLAGLKLGISKDCPYVFQEFIPGQEWCTHASVIDGRITSFVCCPSNDMLMTYENATSLEIGHRAEAWTRRLLQKLSFDLTPSGKNRQLTGHFSFDFIQHSINGEIYPIECNARVHTACILLPLNSIAEAYDPSRPHGVLRPNKNTAPRSWIYNDLIMRYLPFFVPFPSILNKIHPSLGACVVDGKRKRRVKPDEGVLVWRKDPTLVRDDWIAFLVLWHVYWPVLLLARWWQGIKWTRLNVSTGRIFEG